MVRKYFLKTFARGSLINEFRLWEKKKKFKKHSITTEKANIKKLIDSCLPKKIYDNCNKHVEVKADSKGVIKGNFDGFIKWLSVNLIEFKTFKTLGRRSSFDAHYNQQSGSITIRTSKFKLKLQKNPQFKGYLLKHNAIKKIFERFNNAPESQKYMPSYYELPPLKEKYLKGEYTTEYWPEAPDKVATPAIPAIIKYWHENS